MSPPLFSIKIERTWRMKLGRGLKGWKGVGWPDFVRLAMSWFVIIYHYYLELKYCMEVLCKENSKCCVNWSWKFEEVTGLGEQTEKWTWITLVFHRVETSKISGLPSAYHNISITVTALLHKIKQFMIWRTSKVQRSMDFSSDEHFQR